MIEENLLVSDEESVILSEDSEHDISVDNDIFSTKVWHNLEKPSGYVFRGKDDKFSKSVSTLKLVLKKGSQHKLGDVDFKVVDSKNDQNGREIKVETRIKSEKGLANVKVYGPNSKLEYSIMVNKVKRNDSKYVKIVAEKFVLPYLEHTIKGMSFNKFVSHMCDKIANKNSCELCDSKVDNITILEKPETGVSSPKSKKIRMNKKKLNQRSQHSNQMPKGEKSFISASSVNMLQGSISNSKVQTVPKHISSIVSVKSVLYKVKGDGACGANAVAAHIYNDESYGHNLRKNINDSIISHWDYYKNKFAFPYQRKVGINGKEVCFEEPQELLGYLKNSHDSSLLWMDSEDFHVICNMYQLQIKVISYHNENDTKPVINIIGPDETMKKFALVPKSLISDIILYHQYETHFDLITSLESLLVKTHHSTDCINDEVEEMEVSEDNVKDKVQSVKPILDSKTVTSEVTNNIQSDVEILSLSANIDFTNSIKSTYRCKICDFGADSVPKIKEHMEFHNEDGDWLCMKCDFQTNKLESFKNHIDSIHIPNNSSNQCDVEMRSVISPRKHQIMENNCDNCDFTSLDPHAMKLHKVSHRSTSVIKCSTCDEVFDDYSKLSTHKKLKHRSFKLCKYFELGSCLFGDNCLYSHKKLEAGQLRCFDCGDEFQEKHNLMLHRKNAHRSGSVCKNYLSDSCRFSNESCWWIHQDSINVFSEKNQLDFQKVPHNTAPPSETKEKLVMKTVELLSKQVSQMISILQGVGLMK